MKFRAVQFLLLAAILAVMVGLTGCATNDPENTSARPWNAHQGWEGGGMGGMMDSQRR